MLAETSSIALFFDHIRSSNQPGRPVWAAEFQGGPVCPLGFYRGRVPSSEDIRRWMLTAIASGVTGINFWVTRAEIMAMETNGFSLLDSEGDTTERFEEAARVGAALNQHPELFGQPSWPGADVAILINEWNYQSCAAMPQGGEHLTYSIRGWHRLLWESGIPADFVEVSLADKAELNHYKALILPFPLSLSEEIAEKLSHYVEQGGNLISEACPGRLNEHAFAHRGELSPILRKLFGVRHHSLQMVREPEGGARWSLKDYTWGDYLDAAMLTGSGLLAGHTLCANVYLETFSCEGSEPCLLFRDAVVGAVRQVGKGCAWLLGTFVGHNGTAYRDTASHSLLRALLAQSGVTPAHKGKLLLRRRAIPGKEAWLFTNPTPSDITESINVSGWKTITDLFNAPLDCDGDYIKLQVPGLDVRCLVLEK